MALESTTNGRVIYLVDADTTLRGKCGRKLGELGYITREFDEMSLALEDLSIPCAPNGEPEQVCVLVNVDLSTVEMSRPEKRDHLIEPAVLQTLRQLEVPFVSASAHVGQMDLQALLQMAFMAFKEGAAAVLALPFEEAEVETELNRVFCQKAGRFVDAKTQVTETSGETGAIGRSSEQAGLPEYLQCVASLSDLQRQTHDLMLEGLKSEAIANAIGRALNRVHKYRSAVLTKMGVDSAVALLAKARSVGYVSAEPWGGVSQGAGRREQRGSTIEAP